VCPYISLEQTGLKWLFVSSHPNFVTTSTRLYSDLTKVNLRHSIFAVVPHTTVPVRKTHDHVESIGTKRDSPL